LVGAGSMSWVAVILSLLSSGYEMERGRLSVYRPGDGFNSGELACGGEFTEDQVHIAHRKWWRIGCGTPVLVCARRTKRCEWATVQDAGPFGIYRGKLKRAVAEGRWKVWVKRRPPPGWRWRAVGDLSVGLWRKLGKPRALSEVTLYYRSK